MDSQKCPLVFRSRVESTVAVYFQHKTKYSIIKRNTIQHNLQNTILTYKYRSTLYNECWKGGEQKGNTYLWFNPDQKLLLIKIMNLNLYKCRFQYYIICAIHNIFTFNFVKRVPNIIG